VVIKLATPYLGTHPTALDDFLIVGLRLFVPSRSCKIHSSRASGCGEIRPRIFQVGQPDGPGTHRTIWATFLTERLRF